jgi:hypothetical protein
LGKIGKYKCCFNLEAQRARRGRMMKEAQSAKSDKMNIGTTVVEISGRRTDLQSVVTG